MREVAAQKTAALRMSLHAVADQHMPFLAETTEPRPHASRATPGPRARSGGRGADGARARDVRGDADQ